MSTIDITAARHAATILRAQFTPEQIASLEAFCLTHTYSEGMRAFFNRPSKAELKARRTEASASAGMTSGHHRRSHAR